MKLKSSLLTAAAVAAFATSAYAVPLTGTVTLTASVIMQPTTVTVDQASGLNFVGATGADNGSAPGTVFNYGGSAITAGTGGTINDIADFVTYAGGVLFTLSNGLSFSLDAPLTVQRQAATASSMPTLSVGGLGTFAGGGYDPTRGIFTITTQGTMATFNLASGSGIATATAIPEPASLALLGGSLAAAGVIFRRRK